MVIGYHEIVGDPLVLYLHVVYEAARRIEDRDSAASGIQNVERIAPAHDDVASPLKLAGALALAAERVLDPALRADHRDVLGVPIQDVSMAVTVDGDVTDIAEVE
jgi:hypothetical protein